MERDLHFICLVEEAQLAVLVLAVGGVAEDAAVEQRAVDVADHRAEVARRVLLARLALALLDRRHVVAQRLVPLPAVGLVDRVDGLAARGHLHVGLRQHELADRLVEREALARLAAEGDDERRRGGVEAVAGDDEAVARLQGRGEAVALGRAAPLVVVADARLRPSARL